MLSDKYLWPVPELTPVHETYELVPFQEPVTEEDKEELEDSVQPIRVLLTKVSK
jgi:hypothetical protein